MKFTPIDKKNDNKSLITKESRYMCPVTHDALSNSVPCAVLRPTYGVAVIVLQCFIQTSICRGDVVTLECVEKIIKKDWIHPLTSQKLTEKDIIIMQRVITPFCGVFNVFVKSFRFQGGTGYASTNEKLKAKHERPALQA